MAKDYWLEELKDGKRWSSGLDGWLFLGKAGTEVITLGRSGQAQLVWSSEVLQADWLTDGVGVSIQWLPLAG